MQLRPSDIPRLKAWFADPNVAAFARVIRQGESSQGDDAYWLRFGGAGKPAVRIAGLAAHPRVFEPTADGRVSSAAGAYQFTATTWDEIAGALGITDFSRESQDTCYVGLLLVRGILIAVLEGRFEDAVALARPTWTSLPGAAENNARWTMAKARALYEHFGGRYYALTDQAPAPVDDRSTQIEQPAKENAMGALVFLPAILQMIPALIGMFGKGENATRNEKAAQIVVDTFTKAVPGAVNAQDAITKAQADPEVLAAAKQAVLADPVIVSMMAIGPTGIKEARDANVALVAASDKWWKLVLNPVFLVTLITIPLVYIIVLQLVAFMYKVSADVIAQTIGTVIGLVLGGVMGFWMGQTYQQSRQVQRSTDATGTVLDRRE